MMSNAASTGGDGLSVVVPDLVRNRAIFDRFNRIRFQNVHHVFPENYTLIFKIVPFLVHTNFRGLPGFVDHPETPHGIKYYVPDEDTVTHIQRYFSKTVKVSDKDDRSGGFVEFLSVMGSVGSVAQTRQPDFDMWVGIHRDEADDEGFKRFCDKLRGIEEWLATMRLEGHFFPTDIKSVKNNVFGAVDDESCGSAQALMLKDEYYRTAILIAGKVPYWWMVDPAVSDEDYHRFHEKFHEDDEAFSRDFIDIGNVSKIEKTEFFGAALWQLVKSLHYPFKSFIKMCLINKYLFGDTEDRVTLLSNTLKENVIRNENLETDAIDAYLLMFNSIDSFFTTRDKAQEADLLRSCFYLKVQPNLSGQNKNAHAGSHKQTVMNRYVKSWSWDPTRTRRLDSFHRWTMEEVMKFDHDLRVYMIRTFSELTKSKDLIGGNSMISQTDLTIISRKLMAYYMPKPKKIKHFCFSFDDSVSEPELAIARQGDWRLYRGEMRRDQFQPQFDNVINTQPHLSDLCFWVANSKIFGAFQTKLSVYSGDANISFAEVSKLVTAMAEQLLSQAKSKPRHYLEDPFIRRVFVTCLLDPADEADRIAVFYANSWSELFADHFSSETDMRALLCEMVSGYIREGRPNPVQFLFFHSVTGRLKEMLSFKGYLTDLVSAFRTHRPEKAVSVYLDERGGRLDAFMAAGHEVRHVEHPDLAGLLDGIARQVTSDLPREYRFGARNGVTGFFSAAAGKFRAGEFDIFAARPDETRCLILFADDLNRVSACSIPKAHRNSALRDIRAFVAQVAPDRRLNVYDVFPDGDKIVASPAVVTDAAGASNAFRWTAIQKTPNPNPAALGAADFRFETASGALDLSVPAERARMAAAVRQAGATGLGVSQIVLDKSLAVPPADLLKLKLTLEHDLTAALIPF